MRKTPRAWVPLVFVAVALVLLLGTPLVVSRQVRKLRGDVTDVVLSPGGPGRSGVDDSTRAAAIARERTDERELTPLVARLGPEAVDRLIELRSAEQRWRATNASEQRLQRSPL